MPSHYILLLCLPLLVGCPSREESLPPLAPAEAVGPLVVLVVDDAPLAAAMEREWLARIGKPIEVQQVTAETLRSSTKLQADCVIYPPGLMGELVQQRRLLPFPTDLLDSDVFNRRDLLPLTRQYEMRWGEQTYAVPLAAPRWALLYRSDLLEQLGAQPPTTWPAYAALAARLQERANLGELAPAAEAPWSGTVEPWGNAWRGELLLARAASSIGRQGQLSTLFEFASMDSLVDSPPFHQALENMREVGMAAPADLLAITPAEVRRRILTGEAGMAITWLPTPYDPASADATALESLPLGVAPLPGSESVYLQEAGRWEPRALAPLTVPLVGFAGRVGSVAANSSRRQAALDFLLLLAGPQWSADVTRRSSQAHPFRRQHVTQLAPWLPPEVNADTARQYSEYLDRLELSPLVLVSPRIPGRPRYMAALDTAVAEVVQGQAAPAEAAAAAAAAWNVITKELGPEEQRSAYRQSAGVGF